MIGLIANLISPSKEKGGFLGAMTLGTLGAILGGLFGNIVFGISIYRLDFLNFTLAALGAMTVLLITRRAKTQ